MSTKAGVWIDHKKAVIVFASADGITTTTLDSGIGPRTRDSGQAEYPKPDGPEPGRGENRHEGRHNQLLDRYYDEVISRLAEPESLLILGPGEAKLQLKDRLNRVKALASLIVGIQATDQLTEPQIVAKVKEHYWIGS
jgi:hypothetical protein